MLVLTRRANESIQIGPNIEVSVVAIRRSKVRLLVSVTAGVAISRAEQPGGYIRTRVILNRKTGESIRIPREPWRDLPCNAPAAENAGCDRCGSYDRAPRSRYCTHCLAEGYVVYVDGVIETGYLHDTPDDARDEAQLVSESAPGETVETRGPNGFREIFPPHEPRSQ
jgi:sRNA-binding carbon storage regulator CsrA